MAVSKVNYGDDTLIDLTEDTVTPSNLMKGSTAHDSAGNSITGVLETTEITTTLSAESTNVQVPGAKCVYDAIQSSSSDIFHVTLIVDSNGKFIANKTFDEIKAAYAENKQIIAQYDSSLYRITEVYLNGKDVVFFAFTWTNGNVFYMLICDSKKWSWTPYYLLNTMDVVKEINSSSTDSTVPSAKAVYDAIQSNGSDLFYVNLTQGSDGKYTADKTFDEIKAAYAENKQIIVRYVDRSYHLSDIVLNGEDIAVFYFTCSSSEILFTLFCNSVLWGAYTNYYFFKENVVKEISSSSTDSKVPSAKAVYDAIQTSSVQSDYDQNDSSQSDYIKNRTHYKEIVHQEEVDLLPETEIDFSSLGDEGYTQSEPLNIQVGDTVKVLWDNQEYECKAQLMPQFESSFPDDIIVFGNLYSMGIDDISTSEIPFGVVSNYVLSESGFVSGFTIMPMSECTNPITVKIFTGGDKVVYHKLDVNYLPISEGDISLNDNNIVTSKPLIKYFSANRSDWDVDDNMDLRFIKNRPFCRRTYDSNGSLISTTITIDENGIYKSLNELYSFDDIVENSYGDVNLTVHWHDGTYNCILRGIYEYWVDEYGDSHSHTHFVFGNVSDIDNEYSSDSAPFLIYSNYNPETKKTRETYIKAYDGFTGELTLQIDAEYRRWSYETLDNKYLDINSLQSDWDEENGSSPRYIHNKPFSKNKSSGNNIYSIIKDLEFNDSGVCITQDSFFNLQEHFYKFNPVNSNYIFVKCNWNGSEYKCKVRYLTCEYYDSNKGSSIVDYYYAFGNVSSIDSNYSDTAPFLVYVNYNPETHQNGETYIVSQDGSTGTIPFEAYWNYDYWHYNTIDNRYLNLSTNVSQGDKNPVTGDAVYNAIQTSYVQSDYNQNDDSQPDYVKNRTHWAEEIENLGRVYLDAQFTKDIAFDYYMDNNPVATIRTGTEVVVTLNGSNYTCQVSSYSAGVSNIDYIGNLSLEVQGAEDTGEPFLVYLYKNAETGNSGKTIFISQSYSQEYSSESYTIKIFSTVEKNIIYHKLDNNYLRIDDSVSQNSNNPISSKAVYNAIQSAIGNALGGSY